MSSLSKDSLIQEFRKFLEATAALAESRRIVTKPYRSSDLTSFSRLPLEKQAEILEHLKLFLQISSEGSNRVENVRKLYSKRGWIAPGAFFDLIADDMEIEFYNFNNQQIFRNIEFFRLSHRTIEEICTMPWYDLYERDHEITDYMLELTRMLSTGEITGCMSYLTRPHEVRDSNARLRAGPQMGPLFVGPIWDREKTTIGYFSTFRTP